MGDRFQKCQPGLVCIEVWPEGLEHHFPGIGLTLANQFGHVQEASVVVQQNLASAFIALVDQSAVRRIGDMMGVPTHYTRLLAHLLFEPGLCEGMRLFTSGSAPMSEAVHAEFTARTGHRILERYGMSEAGMITSNPYFGDRVPGTVGFALPGVEVRVCDTEGQELAPGETGTVEMRGPNLFTGYWKRPDKTKEAMRPDGFFITGDIGSLDADLRLTLEGRASDMIISGGLNVYPKEVEILLDEGDNVLESAVVGLPHSDLGEAVTAFLVPSSDTTIDTNGLAASLRDRIASFKHPKRYVIIEQLPRNTMGKVQKNALRTRHADLFEAEE